jgi:hypothetical protein
VSDVEPEVDPWSLECCQDYVRSKVAEGIYRCRPFHEILDAILSGGLGLDLGDMIERHAKEREKMHADYVFSRYRACPKCHVVKDVASEMICNDCAAGKHPFSDLMA